jgi:hypothetical protein
MTDAGWRFAEKVLPFSKLNVAGSRSSTDGRWNAMSDNDVPVAFEVRFEIARFLFLQ